jgi:hypothetical protein
MKTVLCIVTAACGALDNLRLLAHFLTRSRSPCQGAACGTCDALPAGHISSSVAGGMAFLWIHATTL